MSYASVNLTAPPSANRMWVPGDHSFFKAKKYSVWKDAAGWEVAIARKGFTFSEPIEVTIIVRRTNQRADIDNMIKPTLDALQHGQLIKNDCQVECVLARWAKDHDLPVMNGRDVRVEVRSC